MIVVLHKPIYTNKKIENIITYTITLIGSSTASKSFSCNLISVSPIDKLLTYTLYIVIFILMNQFV